MKLILDLDGTIYGPSKMVKKHVVKRLKQILDSECRKKNETLFKCIHRLSKTYNTNSMFMMICLHQERCPVEVLKQSYIHGFREYNEAKLRDGIDTLFVSIETLSIFTNAPEEWAWFLAEYFGFKNLVENVFGLSKYFLHEKPDPRSFARIKLDHVVFVDDMLDNCFAGYEVGWKSFWFPEDNQQIHHDCRVQKIHSAEAVAHYIQEYCCDK